MLRLLRRIVVPLVGLCAVGVLVAASEAGAAEACGPDSLGDVRFSVGASEPVADLADLGPLVAGQSVTMVWDGEAEGCADLRVTLAAHRVDASPTAELVQAQVCGLVECAGSLTIEVPERAAVCRGDLVAAVGPPQLDRSLYGSSELAAARIDAGDCAAASPSAFIAVLCVRGGIDVAVSNTGELDAVIVLRVDGVVVSEFEVAGGTERSELIGLVEDTPITVAVLSGGEVVVERSLRPDCSPEPALPLITPDCAAGGASVMLDNPTSEPIRYRVVVDGIDTEVVVGAYRVERHAVAIDEDTERQIAVMAPDAGELARATVRRDCERPRATVALDCATSSAAFTLANDGSTGTLVTLVLDGRIAVAVPVAAGRQGLVALVPVVEDRTVDVAARSGGIDLVSRQLTVDCEPPPDDSAKEPPTTGTPAPPPPPPVATPSPPAAQVLGVSVRQPSSAPVSRAGGTLPTTGTDPFSLVIAAGWLLTLGGFFLIWSVRRTESGFGAAAMRR
jgi:hypothetical protein